MANGYCPLFLIHQEAMAGVNPANKLRPMGFLRAVLSQMDDSTTQIVNEQYDGGHTRSVSVAYSERPLVSAVRDTVSACDVAVTPVEKEYTFPALLHREVSLWFPDSLIRQYCKDVSEYVKIMPNGNAGMLQNTQVMRKVYDNIVRYAGILMTSINAALVTQASTGFGKNVVTGSAAARELTFSLTHNGMEDAFVQMLADLRENEFCDDNVVMVGNGYFANLDLMKAKGWFANAAADNGLNKANIVNTFPEIFYDKDTTTIWGANQIGLFERGSLALISYDKNVGNFQRHLATSEYFNMAVPVDQFSCPQQFLDRLNIDIQIKEIDCATTITVNDVSSVVSEGVLIILSKDFSLFEKPTTLWNAADPLTGTNGTLRYQITAEA